MLRDVFVLLRHVGLELVHGGSQLGMLRGNALSEEHHFKLMVFMLNKHNSHISMNRARDGSKSKQGDQSNTVKVKKKKKVTRAVPM